MRDTRTHYLEAFPPRLFGVQLAACLTPITDQSQIAPLGTKPTCFGCAMWLDNLDFIAPAPTAELERTA